MTSPRLAAVVWALVTSVGGCQAKPDGTVTLSAGTLNTTPRRDEPPVALNASSPVHYPEALASQRLGGTVVLRLFVDSTGKVVADSSAVQESSGYPALDSAALRAAPELRYAPALRDGIPVAAPFLQPVDFRASAGGTK